MRSSWLYLATRSLRAGFGRPLLMSSTSVRRLVSAVESPNVVLMVVDSLRADHLGSYGYARPTTPRLEALAAEGARFAVAYSPTSTTGPSHATLFTGLPPLAHGVTKNGLALEGGLATLAEVLSAQGFAPCFDDYELPFDGRRLASKIIVFGQAGEEPVQARHLGAQGRELRVEERHAHHRERPGRLDEPELGRHRHAVEHGQVPLDLLVGFNIGIVLAVLVTGLLLLPALHRVGGWVAPRSIVRRTLSAAIACIGIAILVTQATRGA